MFTIHAHSQYSLNNFEALENKISNPMVKITFASFIDDSSMMCGDNTEDPKLWNLIITSLPRLLQFVVSGRCNNKVYDLNDDMQSADLFALRRIAVSS